MIFSEKSKQLCLVESKSHLLLRSQERSNALGEVFTPTALVLEILEELPDEQWEEGKTFLDPTCGNGQFLAAVAIIKRELGHDDPLASIYGVDLMADNVEETKQRLLAICGDTKENREHLENNILCKDGLTYEYTFGQSPAEKLFEW